MVGFTPHNSAPALVVGRNQSKRIRAHPAYSKHERERKAEGDVRPARNQGRRPPHVQPRSQNRTGEPEQTVPRTQIDPLQRGRDDRGGDRQGQRRACASPR